MRLFKYFSNTINNCKEDTNVDINIDEDDTVLKIEEMLQFIIEKFSNDDLATVKQKLEESCKHLQLPFYTLGFNPYIFDTLFANKKLYIDVVRCSNFYDIQIIYKYCCFYMADKIFLNKQLSLLNIFDDQIDRDIKIECLMFISTDFLFDNFISRQEELNIITDSYWKCKYDNFINIIDWYPFKNVKEIINSCPFEKLKEKIVEMNKKISIYKNSLDYRLACQSYYELNKLEMLCLNQNNNVYRHRTNIYNTNHLNIFLNNNTTKYKYELENLILLNIHNIDICIVESLSSKAENKIIKVLTSCLDNAKQISIINMCENSENSIKRILKTFFPNLKDKTQPYPIVLDRLLELHLPNLENLSVESEHEQILQINCNNYVNLKFLKIIIQKNSQIIIKTTEHQNLEKIVFYFVKPIVWEQMKNIKILGNFPNLIDVTIIMNIASFDKEETILTKLDESFKKYNICFETTQIEEVD